MKIKKVKNRGIKLVCFILVGLLMVSAGLFAQNLPANPPSGYYNVNSSNPQGTVDYITYGSNYAARVYMPPGYPQAAPYSSMYLMHGMGGSEASWHDNDLYAHIQLDNLIAEGKADPFVIVFTRNDMNNWNFTSILINQLIPYIESNYQVSSSGANRALGGLSMGGMQTCNIGLPNADKFNFLMPSSSAPGINGQSQLFPDGGTLAKNNLKLILFTCGQNEQGSYGCNNNNTVRNYCNNVGVSSSIMFEYIAPGGGHDRNTWRPSFWNFAQMACQRGFTSGQGTPTPTSPPTSPPTAPPASNIGDVDNNGVVDITDALKIAQSYVGLPVSGTYIESRADTNCDGSINIVDALLIAQYYVGLISQFC